MLLQLDQNRIYAEATENALKNHKSTTDLLLMTEGGSDNPQGWRGLPKITWVTTEQPLKPAPKIGRKLDI